MGYNEPQPVWTSLTGCARVAWCSGALLVVDNPALMFITAVPLSASGSTEGT